MRRSNELMATTTTLASAASWVIIVRIGSLVKSEFKFHISVEDFQCLPASREIWLVAHRARTAAAESTYNENKRSLPHITVSDSIKVSVFIGLNLIAGNLNLRRYVRMKVRCQLGNFWTRNPELKLWHPPKKRPARINSRRPPSTTDVN